MSKLLLTVSLSFITLIWGAASAEDQKSEIKPTTDNNSRQSVASKTRIKGPVSVTSETLTADNKAHTALFEKNVVAKTTDITMSADRMLVSYTDRGDITRIQLKGNVKVQQEDKVITSQEAIYYAETPERLVFSGNPQAFDGQNVLSGTKITYYVDEERSFVEGGSKVIMKSKQHK